MNPKLVIGLDIGTGGARAVAVDSEGNVVSSASHISPPPFMNGRGGSEQVPDFWIVAATSALALCVKGLAEGKYRPSDIGAICLDATSGTIVILDENKQPLYPGLMHNDCRAFEEAELLNVKLASHCEQVGYRFGATFALPKILWLQRNFPDLFEKARLVAHQADIIVGRLTGVYGLTDPSNALKTGFNLVTNRWPDELEDLGIGEIFPFVVPSGEELGLLSPEVAEEIGIPAGTPILAGVTDSTAAFLATGASEPGDFCSSLGTTLALKGVSKALVRDPHGVVYCHRHPSGDWLPGGASNVGGACLQAHFGGGDLAHLDGLAQDRFPSPSLCYPLVQVGERFPFSDPIAEGFFDPADDPVELYLSMLQGVALVERWCYERLERLGVEVSSSVFTSGGGSKSDVWNQVRANVLQKGILRCRSSEAAFGVAVLAGSKVFYGGDLVRASKAMTARAEIFEPDRRFEAWAEESLGRLKDRCRDHGWIGEDG